MTPGFPHNGKSFRGFSTQWKKVFHTVENCPDHPPFSLNPFSLSP